MRSPRTLFLATALLEGGTGLLLLVLPSLVMWILLGVRVPSPEALALARVGGVALLAISLACGGARDDPGSQARHGLLWALLTYNLGASLVLAWAGTALRLSGIILWPAVALHAALVAWCATAFRALAGV